MDEAKEQISEGGKNQQRKKVGLALSGGFIRATAQIGVIEVLEENNIPIDIISSCSSGAIIAGAYAAGTLPQLKKRLIEGRPKDYLQIIFEPTWPKKGLLKGQRNRKFFEEFVADKNFDDLNKKLLVASADLRTMQEVLITQGSVSQAVQAATSVPGIFVPVEIDGKFLVDGANFNLIPSRGLYDKGADYVIAIYVSQPPNPITIFLSILKRLIKRQKTLSKIDSDYEKDLHIFRLIKRAVSLTTSRLDNLYHHFYPYDIMIKPDLKGVKRIYIHAVESCIQRGREAALKALPQIKKDLGIQ